MTKLLNADWLRGVQLFNSYAALERTITQWISKRNKMADRQNLNKNAVAVEINEIARDLAKSLERMQ